MSITTALSELVAVLTKHAEVMSGQNVPPERAVEVIERVRAATVSYADETFEVFGWGSPFSDTFEDEEQDDEAAESSHVPGEMERISISGRWDFIVSASDAWFTYVARELEKLGAPDCTAQLNSGAQAMHELLSHSTPFDTYTSHGFSDGGQDWVIERVPKTLSEMTEEERYA